MKKEEKLTSKEAALFLKEALQPFCDTSSLRQALEAPFRHKGCVWASNGNVLIRIQPRSAGVAVGPFKEMNKIDVSRAMPQVGFEDLLQTRTLNRDDIVKVMGQMQLHESSARTLASADLCDILLPIEALSHIEVAMRIFGAEQAQLVYHRDCKVMLQLENEKRKEAVSIVQMGWSPKKCGLIVQLPTSGDTDEDARIDLRKGMAAWDGIKAELERKEEEMLMAPRKIYLVEMVKRSYVPVYARNEAEAEHLCKNNFFEPEDDGDDEWMLGDTVPEEEDLECLADCYQTILTRDGEVDREEIPELDRISREWKMKKEKSLNRKRQ